MLIKFDFENFKSYKVKNDLSLVSYTKLRTNPNHERKINGLSILRYLGIYGNNATGKSTILEAVKFYKGFICGLNVPINNISFKGNEDKPTRFNAVFSIGDEIYQYGFSVAQTQTKKTVIQDEVISVVGSGPRRGKEIYSKKNGINKSYIEKGYEALFAFIYNGYINSNKVSISERLFLSYATKQDRLIKDSKLSNELLKIFEYIKNNIVVIGANTTNLNFISREFVGVINKYLTQFDRGLEKVDLVDLSEKDYEAIIPPQIRDDVYNQLGLHKGNGAIINANNTSFIFVNKNSKSGFEFRKLKSKHKYIEEWFDFSDESEGTRKFITLMSYFATKKTDVTFFIDELERSMHPDACKYLFSFFEKEYAASANQFIFTSHNEQFIKSYLRRDEIYFTDKDMFGGSIVYPQTDFKSVNSTNIAKKYLNGDYKKVS